MESLHRTVLCETLSSNRVILHRRESVMLNFFTKAAGWLRVIGGILTTAGAFIAAIVKCHNYATSPA